MRATKWWIKSLRAAEEEGIWNKCASKRRYRWSPEDLIQWSVQLISIYITILIEITPVWNSITELPKCKIQFRNLGSPSWYNLQINAGDLDSFHRYMGLVENVAVLLLEPNITSVLKGTLGHLITDFLFLCRPSMYTVVWVARQIAARWCHLFSPGSRKLNQDLESLLIQRNLIWLSR